MLKQQTVQKLRKMNMQPMVDAASSVDGAAGNLTKEEWLDMLVDRLYEERMATKVNNLVNKGYVIKTVSEDDKRECHLSVSDRFYKYYGNSTDFIQEAAAVLEKQYSPEALAQFASMLQALTNAVK